MSARFTRARKRARLTAALVAEARQLHTLAKTSGPGRRNAILAFVAHLRQIHVSGQRVWPIVTPLLEELKDPQERDEWATITAQLVNPRLTGWRTPGSVDERRARGTPPGSRKPPRSPDRPEEGQDHP